MGDATELGKVAVKSTEITHDKTPLGKQLDGLAKFISIIGFTVAGLVFITLLIKTYSTVSFLPTTCSHWTRRHASCNISWWR